ncbi:MAG: helix-turn-helix transcriptional regulator [Candidatus Omnitrophica bacterium]|nr:helix-turn-helix transcriptional regulator [Candidatus Omnitrophota bacterium]
MKVYQELAILGLLKEGPKHGYEIKKLLKNVLGVFTSFESTSIYYPLKNLEEKGYLEKQISKEGLRPERYMYKLTYKGAEELNRLLIDNFLSLKRPFVNVDLSLYFLPFIDKEILSKKMKIRLKALERVKRWLAKRIIEFNQKDKKHLKKILEHNLKLVEAEIEFTKDLLRAYFG